MDVQINRSDEAQTVFIVDDDPHVLMTLSNFLSAAGVQVETFTSAKAFLTSYTSSRAGCLLLDIKMPEMSGLELLEQLHSQSIPLPIIVVSGKSEVKDAVQAMKLGAFEFIEIPYAPSFLLKRLRDALEFDRFARAEQIKNAEIKIRYDRLTKRELSILVALLSGTQSKVIAHEMNVSVSTINNHRANIMKKIQVNSPVELFRFLQIADPELASKLPKR